MKKYWHRLNNAQQKRVKERKDYTLGEFMNEYSQPDWCEYPKALEGQFGCWSLFYGTVHSEKFCKKCECYKPPESPNDTQTSTIVYGKEREE